MPWEADIKEKKRMRKFENINEVFLKEEPVSLALQFSTSRLRISYGALGLDSRG